MPPLERRLGLLALAATGICSMVGAGINVVPIVLQRNVPGIGPWVLLSFALAAVPAVLAAFAYAALSAAMPRAGGSYLFASRSVSPFAGFAASFSQWFGLSIAIGVVSYIIPAFLRDVALGVGAEGVAAAVGEGTGRVVVALVLLWGFVGVNLRGLGAYTATLIPMMFAMFALGAIVIVVGAMYNHADFAAALLTRGGRVLSAAPDAPFSFRTVLSASAVLFASFIGFDAIAQAGGEARTPTRDLPRAIALAVGTVALFYFAFTWAVYHAVPWWYIAEEAARADVTAPGLLGLLLPPWVTVLIVAGAAIALANDLPAMLLAVSRLMFAWAADGVMPARLAQVHPKRRTPDAALIASGTMATVGVLGSHLAGDFFLGVDLLVISMLVNFLMMCVAVLMLPKRNPALAASMDTLAAPGTRAAVAWAGVALLGVLLAVHVTKDLSAPAAAWYFRSTPVWLLMMALASALFWRGARQLRAQGISLEERCATLPPEDA
jgi:basic amino acid/polyamine antiporter, APA family